MNLADIVSVEVKDSSVVPSLSAVQTIEIKTFQFSSTNSVNVLSIELRDPSVTMLPNIFTVQATEVQIPGVQGPPGIQGPPGPAGTGGGGVDSTAVHISGTETITGDKTFSGIVTGITKTTVGLANVDNTSDASKPVSTAQATADTASKARANHTGTQLASTVSDFSIAADARVVAGIIGKADSTDARFTDARIPLVHNQNASTITDFSAAADARVAAGITSKADIASPTFTGVVGGITKAMVGLTNVDNTTDALKPLSSAAATESAVAKARINHTGTQIASTVSDFSAAADARVVLGITGKANLASPTFTGTVGGITKAMVGLTNVDNTSDAGKPISTAEATALALKADLVAGIIPSSQIPFVALTNVVTAISQAAMLALTTAQVQPGDVVSRSDGAGTFMLTAPDPSLLSNWILLNSPTDKVVSVNSQIGTVVLGKTDVGLANVDNTSDANKPVSTAQVAADTAAKSRLNHTGTQLASTVSDFSAAADARVVAGITGKANTSDPRFTDARTPIDNSVTLAKIVIGGLAPSAITGTAVVTADGRLSDARTPIAHNQTAITITDFSAAADARVAAGITGKVDTTDGRLSDARTPLAHTQLASTITDFSAAADARVAAGITGKANLASPTFTGIVSGIAKTMVGLGNVDNTTDALKPLSSAAATESAVAKARANHTGTQLADTISNFSAAADARVASAIVDTATSTTSVWSSSKTNALISAGGISSLVYQVALNGTTVTHNPSAYRRSEFTCGTAATQIILTNPAAPPPAGQCLPIITILIRTPAGITPGLIIWSNLTGGGSIPLPAASQVVAAQLEWVDQTIGWLVVGVRA